MIESYDTVLFDLDGVIYLGPKAIPGVATAISRLRDEQISIGYVTNNAARSPQAVAEHLNELGVPATVDDVVTAAQAGARLMAERLPAGSSVYILGTAALADEVSLVGLHPVHDLASSPRGVIQGFNPHLTWEMLETACEAIHAGALWVATNTDSTRPSDRGIMPGNGSMVAAVQTAVGQEPLVAGKPFRPLMEEAIRRTKSHQPLFVGDRLDTDIEGAHAVGIDSAMVLTGAHGVADLLGAIPGARPTHLLADLGELFDAERQAVAVAEGFRCREAEVRCAGDQLSWVGPTDTAGQRADLAWAAAHVCWAASDAGQRIDGSNIPEV